MASLTDAAENVWTDFEMRNQALTLAADWTFDLYTAAPGEAGGGTITTYGSYVPGTLARNLTNWSGTQGPGTTTASTGSSGTSSNNVAIGFPAPTSGPQTVTHVMRRSAALLWQYLTLAQPRTLNAGDQAPSFAIGQYQTTVA